MRAYWTATPGLAKAAFVLAAFAAAQFVGLWLLYLLDVEQLPGALLGATLTGIPFLAIVLLLPIGLRSPWPGTVRAAAVGAAGMAAGGIALLVLMLTAPDYAGVSGMQYLFAAAGAIIGLAYAVIAYLGFREASSIDHRPTRASRA